MWLIKLSRTSRRVYFHWYAERSRCSGQKCLVFLSCTGVSRLGKDYMHSYIPHFWGGGSSENDSCRSFIVYSVRWVLGSLPNIQSYTGKFP